MIVVGIVGGIASGKSLVTEHLQSLGAVVLDADRIGHEVLREPSVREQIKKRWGEEVFDPHNEVNRSKLAEIVFDPTQRQELEALEKITHPRIEERLRRQIEYYRASDQVRMLVIDAAIMVKTGWHRLCDEIVFVEASPHLRRLRAERRSWSEKMLAHRESMQAPIERKRELSTMRIDNNGSIQETHLQIQNLWSQLTSEQ